MNHNDDMEASPPRFTIVVQDSNLEVFGAICLMLEQEVLLTQFFHALVIVQLILRHSPSLLLHFLLAGNFT